MPALMTRVQRRRCLFLSISQISGANFGICNSILQIWSLRDRFWSVTDSCDAYCLKRVAQDVQTKSRAANKLLCRRVFLRLGGLSKFEAAQ